tara:strand:+ start:67 stop:639 length:573 start_codon:yes stop_codon:yes gene_type:complete
MKFSSTLILISFFISSEYNIKVPFESESKVSYIGSHPAHSWEGVSEDFKGGIVCYDTDECFIKIQIPVESFNSGNSNRDSNMFYYVESNKYKYVTFYSNSFEINKEILLTGENIKLDGFLEFHGIKKEISFIAFIYSDNQFLKGRADFDVNLSDYNVDRPSLLFTPISDQIIIKCDLYCLINQFKDAFEE